MFNDYNYPMLVMVAIKCFFYRIVYNAGRFLQYRHCKYSLNQWPSVGKIFQVAMKTKTINILPTASLK